MKNKLELLQEWEMHGRAINETYKKYYALTNANPESVFIRKCIFEPFDSYTKCISQLVDDNEEWLDWYRFDCNFGSNPLHGNDILIDDVEKLLNIIEGKI